MTKLQKDHLMILLESMDNKMQTIVQAVCSLNDKIDGFEARLNSRMDHLESIQNITVQAVASLDKRLSAQIDAVDKKIDAVDKKVDAVDKKVDAVDKKVDAVYKELIAHRNDTEQHRRLSVQEFIPTM